MTTIDEALARYDEGESETAKAWQGLVLAAVGLGAALARFTNALESYATATKSER